MSRLRRRLSSALFAVGLYDEDGEDERLNPWIKQAELPIKKKNKKRY